MSEQAPDFPEEIRVNRILHIRDNLNLEAVEQAIYEGADALHDKAHAIRHRIDQTKKEFNEELDMWALKNKLAEGGAPAPDCSKLEQLNHEMRQLWEQYNEAITSRDIVLDLYRQFIPYC
jgi:hypothetical protein